MIETTQMSLKPFITNPYMEEIYQSFRGDFSDDEYYQRLEQAVKGELGTGSLEVLQVECGVGLSILCRTADQSLVQLKIIRGTNSLRHQTECCRIQRYLVRSGFPCTVPIGTPLSFLGCSLQLEEHNSRGDYRDSHDASVMALQAEQLALLNHLLREYRSEHRDAIEEKIIPRDVVWHNPPQVVFSFDKTKVGDEAIRRKAEAAKAIFEEQTDQNLILSHEDWSNKHFRFVGPKVSVIYDWDSLKRLNELYSVGLACSTFTATWYVPTKIFPSREESRAFVDAYAGFSGNQFTKDDRRIISSYAAYTLAYIARCTLAINNGTLKGNDIEGPFDEIEQGMYFL